ncbi:MAG: arginine--tRNA ligase [Acidimicrobiales bacterium]
MSIVTTLSSLVGDAFEAQGIDRSRGEVVVSQRPDLSQFQCNGALAAAKEVGRSPRDIADGVAEALRADSRIAMVDVAGPGFLNLSVTDDFLADVVAATAADPHFGVSPAEDPKTVIVDYGGPNVAKDLHVGHLRPAVIGESVKRLHKVAGHDVRGDVHLGDWGLPMGQLLAELEDRHPELPYFVEGAVGPFPDTSPVTIEDLQVLYPEASARSKADEVFQARAQAATVALQDGHRGYRALWSHFRTVSVDALRAIYDRLGVEFELWLGEASVADRVDGMVEKLLAEGHAYESDGAIVIDVSEPTDKKELPPLMLRNSRGGSTYAVTDLATIQERVEDFGATDIVYVVDLRQSLHFEQVFRAARRTGMAPERSVHMTHAGNGTVNGPDGKPFKTRDGSLPRLGALLDDVTELAMRRLDENGLAAGFPPEERAEIARLVGLGALKFGELSNHRTTNYVFDLERFTLLQGRTGPYLQYVAVRTRSVLAKAADAGFVPGALIAPTHDAERALALVLLQWPEIVARSLEGFAPNTVAEFAYEVAGAFNQFYDACHILSEPNPAVRDSWLALVDLTHRLLVEVLDVLTIEVPERM